MSDLSVKRRLEGYVFSAEELRRIMPEWPGSFVEDYLSLFDNLALLADNIDSIIDIQAVTMTEAGEITLNVGAFTRRLVTVDTYGTAASQALTKINGGNPGEEIVMQSKDSSRQVVVTPDGAFIAMQASFTLESVRDKISMMCVEANIFHEKARAYNG